MGYNKITQFSLRPRELKPIIDMVGQYYRCFFIDMRTKISSEDMETFLTVDLEESQWIDGLQRRVTMRKSAIDELLEWCLRLELEEPNEYIPDREEMIQLIKKYILY